MNSDEKINKIIYLVKNIGFIDMNNKEHYYSHKMNLYDNIFYITSDKDRRQVNIFTDCINVHNRHLYNWSNRESNIENISIEDFNNRLNTKFKHIIRQLKINKLLNG